MYIHLNVYNSKEFRSQQALSRTILKQLLLIIIIYVNSLFHRM